MKDNVQIAREEYLSFLQSLYGAEVTQLGLPKSTAELKELGQRVMKEKGVPDGLSNRILEHTLQSMELQPHSEGQFYTSDAYVRREAAKVLAAFDEGTRRQIHENVTFGSLPLPDLNGMCIKVPEGGYLVLVNFGTLAFCEIVANLLTGLVSFQDSQGDSQPSFTQGQAAGYLLEITATFPVFPDTTFRRYADFRNIIGRSNSLKNHFCASLGDALTNFVIAHEISHFARGHINDRLLHSVPIGSKPSDNTNVEAMHYQRMQEFEADVLGSAILVLGAENTGSQFDAIIAMIATQVFFLVLSLMEQVKNLESPTHAPAAERRQHLLRELDYTDEVIKVISSYEEGIFAEAKSRAYRRVEALDLVQSANSLSASGSLREAADRLGKAVTLADASGDVTVDVYTRIARANVLMRLNEYHAAITEFQRIGELVGDLKYLKDGDDIFVQTARAYSEIGELNKAIDNLKNAIAIAKDRGDSKWEGRYLHNLGLVWAKSEDYWETSRCFLQAWTILSQSDEEEDQSLTEFLREAIVKINAMLMRQISDGQGDMDTKMRIMKKLWDI